MIRRLAIIAFAIAVAAFIAWTAAQETPPPHDGWGQVQEERE